MCKDANKNSKDAAARQSKGRTAEQRFKAANQQLIAANQQLRADAEQLRRDKTDMAGRIKEFECVYGLSQLIEEHGGSMEEILRGLVELMPRAWKYPEITGAQVLFAKQTFKTRNFEKTRWMQSADIKVSGEKIGMIGICYLKEMPRLDEGPFLNQERKLIDALAERIGRVAERIRAVEQVQAANQQFRAANQQLQATGQQLRAANHQLKADEQQLRAANQQLRAANQQLQATEQQLRAANHQLKADEEKLRRINRRLRERKKELHTSREVYRALFEGTMNGVAVYESVDNGSDFVFKDFNPAAERIEKLKRADLIGRSVQDVFPGVREMGIFDVFQRVFESGKAEHYPAVVYKDERIEGWRENHVFKLPGGEVVAVYRDVTEAKQAEQAILDKQKQLRALANELSSVEESQGRRIAGEIHDNLIQPLVFLDIKVKSLLEKTQDEELLDSFEQMRVMLADLIQHSRSFTLDLSYPILHELGLEAAIEEWMQTEIWKKHKIAVEFRADGDSRDVDHAMATFLFKSVKELLINVVKHAEAKTVCVSMTAGGETIEICVEDDGLGFDYDALLRKGGKMLRFGLFNIRERLTHLGGSINIESEEDCGCKVLMKIPMERNGQN